MAMLRKTFTAAAAGGWLLRNTAVAASGVQGAAGFGLQATSSAPAATAAAGATPRAPCYSTDANAAHEYIDRHRPHEAPVHRRHHAQRHGHGHPHLHERHHRSAGPSGEQLEELSSEYGVLDTRCFKHNVFKLPVARQHELLQHIEGVVQHLQALGLDSVAVGRLLQHCPAMFSFPAEERAAILFAELMGDRVARTASQAADLFVRCPALGNTKHVLPELVKVVAEHHGALE